MKSHAAVIVVLAGLAAAAYWLGRRKGNAQYNKAFEDVAAQAPAIQPYAPMGGNAGMAPYGSVSGADLPSGAISTRTAAATGAVTTSTGQQGRRVPIGVNLL